MKFPALVALTTLAASAQAGDQLRTSLASYFYQGDYGGETTTETWVNQLRLNYRSGPWEFGYSQALIEQHGSHLVYDGTYFDEEEDEEFDEFIEEPRSRSGLSDPSLRLSYRWPNNRSLYNKNQGRWKVGLRWKLPLTDEDKFSNGRHEWLASLHRSQRFEDLMLTASIGHHWREHQAEKSNNSRWFMNLGAMIFPTTKTGVGISFFNKQKLDSQSEAPRSLSLNGYWRLTREISITANAGLGLSDVVADEFVGASLTYRWNL